MTGPKHYQEGERLLQMSQLSVRGSEDERSMIAEATAHFLAAQVAATIEAGTIAGVSEARSTARGRVSGWEGVLS